MLESISDASARAMTEETLVPDYTLPDPLVFENGTAVDGPGTWAERRAELLELFEDHVYGRTPENAADVEASSELIESGDALDGAAQRKQVRLTLATAQGGLFIDILMYAPAGVSGMPFFLVPNFDGNHAINPDPAIPISAGVERDRPDKVPERGSKERRFPLELIVKSGYGFATWYYGDVQPDTDDGFVNGVHPLFYAAGQSAPEPDEWGAIGAWAWGNSRVLEHLQADDLANAESVMAGGHSRLGKAALWTAAQDQRFAAAFANDSGCTGAAISRRQFGENVAVINSLFPHWFCANYACYSNSEADLPVDQHELVALAAPRPVYVASATEDLWADPRGEFLGVQGADAVYRMFGTEGLPAATWPPPGEPVVGTLGYHLREGDHDLLEYDWRQYLAFADRHLT